MNKKLIFSTFFVLVVGFVVIGYFYINGSPEIKESAKVYAMAVLFSLLVFDVALRIFKK